jgi:Iap family predicted aminopeptidase
MRSSPFLAPLLLAALLAPACSRADHPSFDQAVDRLFAQGYPQALEAYFCSLGTNPALGFRWAGTSAELAVGDRVAAEMRAMGLSNVRLEPVPVDVFEFEEASLTAAGRRMTASTIAGVPPTPPDGVTAPIVYIKGGTAADFDAAGDISGKLILVDMKMSSWWFCLPAFEAAHRKAAGVVCTFTPDDPKYYSVDVQALGSFDGQYDLDAPPWIYVSRRDGDWLKSQLGAGPVTATMVLKEKVTLARDGGVAYNVVGELPGSRDDGQMVLMAAHQDAHFRAGADDTAALVNMLTIAKAMRASGYRPKTTVVFLATAGEEFGYTNSYYEWIIGAWWAATRAHADWAGRVRALINLESMAVKGAPLGLRSNPELGPWLEQLVSRFPDLLPHGAELLAPVNSWNDQWTFTAAGIPSVKFDATTPEYETRYHSDFETQDIVDWPYLAKIAKFAFRAAGEMDDGLLPYSFKARADDLAVALKNDDFEAAGSDPEVASRLSRAASAFATAAVAFDVRAGSFPADKLDVVNNGLLAIEKTINSSFTALSPADDDITVYPYQSVLRDLRKVDAALAALKADKPDPAAALKSLGETYLTRLGLAFSYTAFLKHVSRIDPGFDRIHWGAQGHLPRPLDVMPQYRKIQSGNYAGVVAELEAKQQILLGELNERLEKMAAVLEWATSHIEGLSRDLP